MTARATQPQDEASALFRRHHHDLENLVRAKVHAPDAVVEDACSRAWLLLILHRPRRDTAYAWLKTVAIREAWRLAAREQRDHRLDLIAQDHEARHDPHDTELAIEARRALELVAALPERQRTYVVLHLNGNQYVDIARLTGTSRSAVNKHLARARKTLRHQRCH